MAPQLRSAQAVCLALMLTIVPAILCAVTVASGYGAYIEFKDWQRRKTEAVVSSRYEDLVVDRDGRVAVAVRDSRGKATHYLDAKRSPIDADSESVPWLIGCSLLRSPQNPLPLWRIREYPAESLGNVVKGENWFFVCDRQTGRLVFEGYDAGTQQRIGFIGPDGFDDGPRDDSKGFPVNGTLLWGPYQLLWTRDDSESNWRYQEYDRARIRFDNHVPLRAGQWVLQSGERLFLVDAVARSTSELLPGMPVRGIGSASRIVPAAADPALPGAAGGERHFEFQKWLTVRTAGRVILLNPAAGQREEYFLPAEWNDREFAIYFPSDGTAVLTSYDSNSGYRDIRPDLREFERDVVTINPAGEITRQARMTMQTWFNPARQPSERTVHWLPSLAIPGPLPSAMVAGVIIPWVESLALRKQFPDCAADSLGQSWPVLAIVTLMAGGLTWRVDRHWLAYREPRSFLWLAFVFLLGVPGYVAWYCHRRWPVRNPVPCPEKTGTEILA